MGALANKDYAVRYYCEKGALIVEVDPDDALIGKQVLNLYSRLYKTDPSLWFMYSNYIYNPPGS